MPNQSGIFHEDYASDMQLRPTTMQRIRVLLLIALLLGAPFILPEAQMRIANLVVIAAIGAIGLNILTGFTGQISLGQGAFLAVGAYSCGLLMVHVENAQDFTFPFLTSVVDAINIPIVQPILGAIVGAFQWVVIAGLSWAAPWPVAVILAAFITALVGAFFGLPSLRLKGLYLAVATLAAQQIVEWFIKRWDPIDGEIDARTTDALNIPNKLLIDWSYIDQNSGLFIVLTLVSIAVVGALLWWLHHHFASQNSPLYQIVAYSVGGLVLFVLGATLIILLTPNLSLNDVFSRQWRLNNNEYAYYWFAMPVAVLVTIGATNLFRTHIGRAFIAIRDQDIAAEVMGVNIFQYKVLAFAVSSFVVGLAGALLALHSTAISFERFTIEVSIEYLAMIIIGGLGSISGSIYGAAFIVVLPELLRALGQVIAGNDPEALAVFNRILPFAQQGVFGAVIVITLIIESGGIRKIWQNTKDYFRLWPFDY